MTESYDEINIIENVDNKFNVLIIDDEKIMRDLLKEILEDSGFTVDVAQSAEEGFKKYKKGLHQIIVLDIRLNGKMNGIDLLKKIKQHDKLVNIIMITGYATIDIAVDCMKFGAWDFITKPFTYDHFQIIVKRASENLLLQKTASQRNYFMQLSRLDGLTEVYNRRLFDIILQSEISRSKRYKSKFSLLLLDLDNFKIINDRFGHQKGDEILKTLALAMKTLSRDTDFICRYGGDEFSFILPETTKDLALILANRLKAKMESIEIEGVTAEGTKERFQVSVSIGLVQFPEMGETIENLIKCADLALIEAKKSKNRVVCG